METLLYELIAGAVASGALYTYLRSPSWVFGPDATFWNPLRRAALPVVDRLAKKYIADATNGEIDYATYEVKNSEFALSVEKTLEEIESVLYDNGFTRMPLAALKDLPDGRTEVGSWAFRETHLAKTQVHVVMFEAQEGDGYELFVHTEPNAINPATAWDHYRAKGYKPGVGTERLEEIFNE